MTEFIVDAATPKWVARTGHRMWLLQQANALLDFFEARAIDPLGGFYTLDDDGRPCASSKPAAGNPDRQIHLTTRMVHCFAIAHLLGRPDAAIVVDHGIDFLWRAHRDAVHGGYFSTVSYRAPVNETKQAYGHAFVLLAASSAKVAGHPEADRLLADISTVIAERFWEDGRGAAAEEFSRDWQPYSRYRGQNANMHLTEALMAACEATGDSTYLRMAERVASLIVGEHAAHNGWRVPEHYTADWQVDTSYSGNPEFRPSGTAPGHSLEWTRLLLQLWELGGRKLDWLPEAARQLFDRAVTDGWDAGKGGFYYTLSEAGSPRVRDRYWWPACEGIGAAAFLNGIFGDRVYEAWYRRIWSFVAAHFIDRRHGGWHPQLDDELRITTNPFYGKPDIYHSLQACLIPLLPTTGSITQGVVRLSVLPDCTVG